MRCFFLALLLSICPVAHADDRHPIPDEASQKEADTLVKEVLGDVIRSATTAEKATAVIDELLGEASNSTDPANCFAIYKAALEIAPDANAALRVIDESAKRFQFDGLKVKASKTSRRITASRSVPIALTTSPILRSPSLTSAPSATGLSLSNRNMRRFVAPR